MYFVATSNISVRKFFLFPSRHFVAATLLLVTLTALSSVALATRFILPEQQNVIRQLNVPQQAELDPTAINILVWNMYKGIREGWQEAYQRRIKDKHILFLQEVFLDNKMLGVLKSDHPRTYLMATSYFDTWNDDVPSGVATASVSNPLDYSYLRSHSREPVAGTPKMGIYVEYDLADTDMNLLTANIHSINFVSAEKMKSMLDRIEERLSAHDGPVILAGDFNTWTKTKMEYLHEMVKRLGFNEVRFPEDHRTRLFSHALDWVFVKDLSIISAKVHDDIKSSDHNALEVVLSYKKYS